MQDMPGRAYGPSDQRDDTTEPMMQKEATRRLTPDEVEREFIESSGFLPPSTAALNAYAREEYARSGTILPPLVNQPPPIALGPTTELPAALERKLLQAAIFRIIGKSADTVGANTFERAISDLEQQIRDTPFAVHLMSLRLKELASK